MVNIGPIEAAGGMTPITGAKLEVVKPGQAVDNSVSVDRVEISQIARLMSEISALPDSEYESDDWGIQNAMFIRPDDWRKFIKHRLKSIYDVVKEYRSAN